MGRPLKRLVFALLASGAVSCNGSDAAPERAYRWVADGKLMWSESVPAFALLDGSPTPEAPPEVLPPGTRIEVLRLTIGADGERMDYVALGGIERLWSNAVAGRVATTTAAGDTQQIAESMVYRVIAKQGTIAEQIRLRCGFRTDPADVSPALRKTLAIWPMWLNHQLIGAPLRSLEQLPSLAEVDSVAGRWQLDRFDTKCVETVREMTRRSAQVRSILKSCNEPMKDPYVERFVSLADERMPGCIPSYRELVHAYAERLLPAIGRSGVAESQLAELRLALAPWRSGVVGFGDIWTSLATGMLDCDALSLVAAEVLARRGWSVETLNYLGDDGPQAQGVVSGHVNLRVTPPGRTRAIDLASSEPKGFADGSASIFDPTDLPLERIEMINRAGGLPVKRRLLPASATESVADEVQFREWLDKAPR